MPKYTKIPAQRQFQIIRPVRKLTFPNRFITFSQRLPYRLCGTAYISQAQHVLCQIQELCDDNGVGDIADKASNNRHYKESQF